MVDFIRGADFVITVGAVVVVNLVVVVVGLCSEVDS